MKTKHFLLCTLMLGVAVSASSKKLPQLGKAPIDEVIAAMTIEEKVDLLVGHYDLKDKSVIGNAASLLPGAAGQTNGIPRLGIPPTVVSDGPAGLRIQPKREGTTQTFYCTHFPVATELASSWNKTLVERVGRAMGDEVKRYGADVLLGPAINIHRNPLNGRNFEYYSEDPLVAGDIATAMINGIQANGVGTSLKHFAMNNQEINRMGNNVIASPRTIREIYLKPFEIAVKNAMPMTVMTSYNLINGTYTSERADLITTILRDEWGFKGLVMTDWFGGKHPVLQMQAGNDLLMPGSPKQKEAIMSAIKAGTLSLEVVDRNVKHMLEYIMQTPRFKGYVATNDPDLKAHADVARSSAAEGMVLLKNLKNVLPLSTKIKNVAVFGNTSYNFIAGGTGSGDVNHAYVVSLTEGLRNAGMTINVDLQKKYETYMKDFAAKNPKKNWFMPEKIAPEMTIDQSTLNRMAASEDVALITIGKTSGEGADRSISESFNMTKEEQALIKNVCTTFHSKGKKAIVILNICSPIETPSWREMPDAILLAWMGGQEGGNVVADILSGKVNPSGKLTMTFPMKYADVNTKDDFPVPDKYTPDVMMKMMMNSISGADSARTLEKNVDYTTYNEGVFVGYRYYDTKNVPVAYPFGYGLSYTEFKYSNPSVERVDDNMEISCEVKNVGKVEGKEVMEVYVAAPGKDMPKPSHELKGFAKTSVLKPGGSLLVQVSIPVKSLASFDEESSSWKIENGLYQFQIASSSRDIKFTLPVQLEGETTETVVPVLLPENK